MPRRERAIARLDSAPPIFNSRCGACRRRPGCAGIPRTMVSPAVITAMFDLTSDLSFECPRVCVYGKAALQVDSTVGDNEYIASGRISKPLLFNGACRVLLYAALWAQAAYPEKGGSVKIDSLKLFEVPPRWLFLKVTTDEGSVGWGEPIVEGRAKTVRAAVEEMSGYLVG